MRPHRPHRRLGQHGQGLVEFALVLPIVLVLVLSVAELGIMFGKISSLGYASREGARTGAALARGGIDLCKTPPADSDPASVDATVIAAAQRVLESPDSGVVLHAASAEGPGDRIRIFKANSAGAEVGPVNEWVYVGHRMGPGVDPETGQSPIDFLPGHSSWPVCSRVNSGPNTESIGVTVLYRYDFVTPIPALINALAPGALSVTLSETTVMALNPTSS